MRTLLAMITLAVNAALVPLSASAAEGMAWDITDTTSRRYYVESVTLWPWATWLIAERNLEVRATQMELKMVVRCDLDELNRRSRELACVVEDTAIIGLAMRDKEQDNLNLILQEYDELLTGAKILLQQRRDGRVLSVGLYDVPTTNRRTNAIREFLRGATRQAICGLDFQIDRGLVERGVWVQPTVRLVEFGNTWSMDALRAPDSDIGGSATTGTRQIDNVGSVPLAHLIAEDSASAAVVTSFGQGVWGQDFDMWIKGDLLFDKSIGQVRYRSWQVWGLERQKTGNQAPYANTGWMKMMTDNEVIQLGQSGSWADNATADTAIGLMDDVMATLMADMRTAGAQR